MAAVDYFLKIEGIDGESLDSKHKGEIDVTSFSWGVSQTGSAGGGGGAGAGRAQFTGFHFTSSTSKASPKLMLACATGEHIKKAELFCRKAGGDGRAGAEFIKLTFEDVLVSSYNQSGSGDVPADSVSLNFARIMFEVHPLNPDGSLGAPVRAGWDLRTNRAI